MENGDTEDSDSRRFIWVEGERRGRIAVSRIASVRSGRNRRNLQALRCCYYKHLKTVEPLSRSNPDRGTHA
ncbi:hypothetical protein BHE74_00023088 [Ensete ventricosum]|uniref:Uncharacterized protein n=1 Tax=Ensete ventricosum TaxID=4639 RepID=A0A426ZEC6_ENSVE|nr:hypothetical protein B296_00022150 [Ensete ventricosum]RWW31656.1 hypothetical protein GW17_00003714 [Ensete ventricosum]RWW69309.1 hypothetical protein BHE74_00023088 [Ensete ventricosum]RZS02183.1 hypothetical protein BHM03_00032169 [Ensete ventricosum]